MDHINSDPGPEPETGEARVESDRLQPIVRSVRRASARWPAGFVLAMVAVLAVSGLAFGAQMLPALQDGNSAARQSVDLSSVEPVIVGDDDPTAEPTLHSGEWPTSPTDSPTAITTLTPTGHPTLPPSGYLSFLVEADGGCARLYWASFDDPSRAYYRIVRSTDSGVEWPLGAGDTLVASVRDASQLTLLDCPAAGTYTYRVFVDKATSAGYVVLVSSHSMQITLAGSTSTPMPTPLPSVTPVPVDMGPLSVTANTNGTYTITWNAYAGPLNIYAYALCYTTNENASFGSIEHFGGSIGISKTAISWTGTFPWAATLKVKVEAIYIPPTGSAQKAGETRVSVIPYAGATPTPNPTPTPTPTATPVPVDMGAINVVAHTNGTYTLTWNAYAGPLNFSSYVICYTTNENAGFGYVEGFGGVISVSKTAISWTGTFPWAATLKVKVEALYFPPAGRAQKAGETHVGIAVYAGTASPAVATKP
jgi:hypothetical protein